LGQIEAGYQDAVDRRLDIAALGIAGVSRQAAPRLDRRPDPGEDGDAATKLIAALQRAAKAIP